MTELLNSIPLGISVSGLADIDFWISVGVLAGTYTLVALGLQLNVGFTGISNFGQAGFMAVGAYTMAIITVDTGLSFWLSLPISIAAAMLFGLVVGLPSLRLREDYFAIATLAMAEVVRQVALNARELTGGNLGFSCNDPGTKCFDEVWVDISETIEGWLIDIGWTEVDSLVPLLLVVWASVILITLFLRAITYTPWGRVLRAVREDEDAARALGKNTLAFKLQSLAISAGIAAIAGWFLALNLAAVAPTNFEPLVTFFGYAVLVLGGLASYWGLIIGGTILFALTESTRFLELGLNGDQEAALRFGIIGVVLIMLMAFRPQGIFGKREEMVLGD
jgi:branched-chain amino acid transport system permease protein